jgi:hypothetical protein
MQSWQLGPSGRENFFGGQSALIFFGRSPYIPRSSYVLERAASAAGRLTSHLSAEARFFMNRTAYRHWSYIILALAGSNVCHGSGTVDQAAERSRLQLAQLPANAQAVLAVQRQLVAARKNPSGPKTLDVVVIGKIGGMPNVWADTHPDFPWYDGQSSFFLVDQKIASQFAAHAKQHGGNHDCAFCRSLAAKNAHAAAVVNLVNERGEILRIDSRELLGLKENQTVVVRGTAKLLGGKLLVIDATGIHVHQ